MFSKFTSFRRIGLFKFVWNCNALSVMFVSRNKSRIVRVCGKKCYFNFFFFEFFSQGCVDRRFFFFKAKFQVCKNGVQSLCQSKFFKFVKLYKGRSNSKPSFIRVKLCNIQVVFKCVNFIKHGIFNLVKFVAVTQGFVKFARETN